MRHKTAYFVNVQPSNHQQYILPSEMYLIKTWLNEGNDSVTVTKARLTEDEYKAHF